MKTQRWEIPTDGAKVKIEIIRYDNSQSTKTTVSRQEMSETTSRARKDKTVRIIKVNGKIRFDRDKK